MLGGRGSPLGAVGATWARLAGWLAVAPYSSQDLLPEGFGGASTALNCGGPPPALSVQFKVEDVKIPSKEGSGANCV